MNVVRDLEVPTLDEAGAELRPVTGEARTELEQLATEWNLGGSVKRLLDALDRAPLRDSAHRLQFTFTAE